MRGSANDGENRGSDPTDPDVEIRRPGGMKTLALTVVAMCAFAANSVLCRMGLRSGAIDPASYTTIRLAAGAVALGVIVSATRGASFRDVPRSWISSALLFLYAIAFSFAYISLSLGSGALILFGA